MEILYIGIAVGSVSLLWQIGASIRFLAENYVSRRAAEQKHKHALELAQWQETERNEFVSRVTAGGVSEKVATKLIDMAMGPVRVRVVEDQDRDSQWSTVETKSTDTALNVELGHAPKRRRRGPS